MVPVRCRSRALCLCSAIHTSVAFSTASGWMNSRSAICLDRLPDRRVLVLRGDDESGASDSRRFVCLGSWEGRGSLLFYKKYIYIEIEKGIHSMFFSLSCGVCVGLVLCVRPPIIESDSHHKDFCLGVWRANGQGVQAGAAKYNFCCLRVHFFL